MLYNIVLVSAIQQHESDIGIHKSPPSSSSLPAPTPSRPSRLSLSLSSLHKTAHPHWLAILRMAVTMSQCHPLHCATLSSPHSAINKELSRHESNGQQAIIMELSCEESCCSAGNNQAAEQAGITQHSWQLSSR